MKPENLFATKKQKYVLQIILFCLSGILLMGCTAASSTVHNKLNTEPQAILDKIWQWESITTPIDQITVKGPENYTIMLTTKGRANIRFDCNRGGGAFKISPGKLSFGPLLSTRMACPPGSMDSQFSRDLQRVVSFFIQDNRLYLKFPHDSGTMTFRSEAID